MKRAFGLTIMMVTAAGSALAQSQTADRGQRAFGVCAPCHSLVPNRNMTGPSLANLWDRQAGTLDSFSRYSDALKSSGIIWSETSLDPWIADPGAFIPDNHMTFRGMKDARLRGELIAFLKEATKPGSAASVAVQQPGGMMGMMGGGAVPNLKRLDIEDRVQSIRYCPDTYEVTTADGKTHKYWERNLRFKTDAGEDGPNPGAPALVGAGMMGDRADVIFSAPDEMAKFIGRSC